MVDIEAKVESVKDQSHSLYIAKQANSEYYQDFLATATAIKSVLSEKDFDKWLVEKMLLGDKPFNEKQYIQYAVEASLARFFIDIDNNRVSLEKKVNPNSDKDVDVQFLDDKYIYNVEVKCPTFDEKEKSEEGDNLLVDIWGRLPDRGKNAIDTISSLLGQSSSTVKKMDNNLKDFLLNAHQKFNPDASEYELNVLLVGCGNLEDLQRWYGYMFAEQGLLTKSSFEPHVSFENVDAIIITDRYYRHKNYLDSKITGAWSFKNGINLIFDNPFHKKEKGEAMQSFLNCFHHYTIEFKDYSEMVMKNHPDDYSVFESRLIPHFVPDRLRNDTSLKVYIDQIDENIAKSRELLGKQQRKL